MSAPIVHGWCPGALRPMESGDGWVVRIRAPLGRLSPEQARGIAALSAAQGNGRIDLSARANMQLRGVTPDSHAPLIAGLTDLGLSDPAPEIEARRNLVLSPFWHRGDATHTVARALTAALAAPDAPDLPGKFGFAVDCGDTPVLSYISADIRIEPGATGGLICRADGAPGGVAVTPQTAADTALDLARWFLATGGAPDGRGRMARHLAKGTPLPNGHSVPPAPTGPRPHPGLTPTGALVALEFGQMGADDLAALANLGPLRLTPWRMVLIEGADRLPDLPGLITDPADPRLRVVACTGAPGCPQGLAPTRPLARALAPMLADEATLHVSGCAKGCAHPGPTPLTLVATGPDRFDLIRNGTATGHPAQRDLTAAQLTDTPAILTESR